MRLTMILGAIGAISLISACNSGGSNNQVSASGNGSGANSAAPANATANAAATGNATQTAPAAGAQAQGQEWAGTYKATADGGADGGTGELTISSEQAGTYRALLEIGREGCAGSVEGRGTAQGNRLVVTATVPDQPRQCQITLTREGDVIRMAEENCSHFHGASCAFDGTARR